MLELNLKLIAHSHTQTVCRQDAIKRRLLVLIPKQEKNRLWAYANNVIYTRHIGFCSTVENILKTGCRPIDCFNCTTVDRVMPFVI